MSALVVKAGAGERARVWLERLQAGLPKLECRPWDEPGDPAEVEYAVVWKPPPGGLARFPNLRCIVSIGAGVDHILADAERPRHVPILRTTGSELPKLLR